MNVLNTTNEKFAKINFPNGFKIANVKCSSLNKVLDQTKYKGRIIDFLNLDVEKMIILYLLLAISFVIIHLSHKNANERFKKKSIFALLGYFLIYYAIMSFIILIIFFELLIEKKHKW